MNSAENHRWPDHDSWNVVLACESRDGNEHHIRQCLICGLTKITVITPRGKPWHEWVTADGRGTWVGEQRPPCRPARPMIEAAA